MELKHKDIANSLFGFGKALRGLFYVFLSKHKLVPAVQSFALIGIRGKRFCRQSRGSISEIRLEKAMGHPPDCVMGAA